MLTVREATDAVLAKKMSISEATDSLVQNVGDMGHTLIHYLGSLGHRHDSARGSGVGSLVPDALSSIVHPDGESSSLKDWLANRQHQAALAAGAVGTVGVGVQASRARARKAMARVAAAPQQ